MHWSMDANFASGAGNSHVPAVHDMLGPSCASGEADARQGVLSLPAVPAADVLDSGMMHIASEAGYRRVQWAKPSCTLSEKALGC